MEKIFLSRATKHRAIEFERIFIRRHTSAGREAAKMAGDLISGARASKPRKCVREIADTFNVHTSIIYRLSVAAPCVNA